MNDFWQTIGGQRFQAQLIRQLTRLADGIETQNGLYERLLEGTPATQELARNYYGQEVEPDSADADYHIAVDYRDVDEYESHNGNCDNCQEDNCQPFIAKATWLHDENGNDVLQHCRCTCTCHLEKEITA